jgi:hypothetical protein
MPEDKNSNANSYYKVTHNEEKDYLEYTRDERSTISDTAKWKAALNLTKRCDNAVYLTSKLLVALKGEMQLAYKVRRRGYIAEILQYARAGLEKGDLDGANSDLDTFEAQFVDFEGPAVRQRFLNKTLIFAAALGVICLILGLSIVSVAEFFKWLTASVSNHWNLYWAMVLPQDPLQALLFIFVGNSLGVVFSAFTRNLNMNFQNLGKFDAAGLKPSLRFIFVAVISTVVATFLQQKIIKVCFGSYCLDESFFFQSAANGVKSIEPAVIAVDPMKCIVIGIICGLADIAITGLLTDAVGKATDKAQGRP